MGQSSLNIVLSNNLDLISHSLFFNAIKDNIGMISNAEIDNNTAQNNTALVQASTTQVNLSQEINREDSSTNEVDQEDPELMDPTFRKLKKKNLIKMKTDRKTNFRDTTETETENESGKDEETTAHKMHLSSLKANTSTKIRIEQTSSEEESTEEAHSKKSTHNRSKLNANSSTLSSPNISVRSRRLSARLNTSLKCDTLTIENTSTEHDDTSSDSESAYEKPPRTLRRSVATEPVVMSSKPVSTITITKLNTAKSAATKACSVVLPKLDESQLSQKDASMIENENDERRKSPRCKSQQVRTSRESIKNNLSVASTKGTDKTRRCTSLNNKNTASATDHGSDNEPPKKVARRTPLSEAESDSKQSKTAKVLGRTVSTRTNTPSRASPRNKK